MVYKEFSFLKKESCDKATCTSINFYFFYDIAFWYGRFATNAS